MIPADFASFPFICRSCLGHGYFGTMQGLSHCPYCQSDKTVTHDELFSLSVAHIDCDAFYCSVEKRDNPELLDKPVVVGGEGRGVVAAACYIARRYGIHSAMPTWQAKRACPQLVILPPRMAHYQAVGRQIRHKMEALSPLVQPLSVDEAFIDLSGTQKLHNAPPALVLARLQADIKDRLGLTVSVGLSGNKSLAKIASDQDKPDGFFVIGMKGAESWLSGQPVTILFGLGKASAARLNRAGISSCADLLAADRGVIRAQLGSDTDRILNLARGIDPRPVCPERAPKSVSSETTFAADISDTDRLIQTAEVICIKLSRELKAKKLWTRRVTLKLKYPDHRLMTRSRTLSSSTQMAHELFAAACHLIRKETGAGQSYRLLGVGVDVSDASAGGAVVSDLLDRTDTSRQRRDRLEAAIDVLHEKMGDNSLMSGRQLSAGGSKMQGQKQPGQKQPGQKQPRQK